MPLSSLQTTSRDATAHRRQSERQPFEGHVTVRVTESDDLDLVEQSLRCKIVEVSDSGIRLESSEMIASDSRLAVWASLSCAKHRFFLKGQVRWVSFEDNGKFHAGVEVIPEPATEFADWAAVVTAPILTDVVCPG